MQALVFEAPEQVRVTQVADARLLAPSDALVRVTAAAVCGSDLHVYHGRETGLDPGTPMGHEMVGVVLEVGAEVTRFRVGDRVAVPFTTSCGACFYCREGLTARCERGELFGWIERGRGLAGVQAEAARVPMADSTLVALPQDLDDRQALLLGDVLATGWHGAAGAGAGPGRVLAVVGCGPIGLMAVLAARELGAAQVFAVDSVPTRLALAAALGATPLALVADPVAAVQAATAGRGADGVVEAVGSPPATRLAIDLCRPGATLHAVGVHVEPHFAFAPGEAYDKNLVYRAGRCSARALMEPLRERLAAGALPVAALFTHELPLVEGARAYAVFAAREDGCIKVLLRP
ncbi:MAG TPA: alcohol dehydrogenase catalytic domain-containing protein [Planctomycetota bacterium]